MSKSSSNFRQADVKRGLRALKAAGAAVNRVVIDGRKIEYILGGAAEEITENEALDKWMAAHADATEGH